MLSPVGGNVPPPAHVAPGSLREAAGRDDLRLSPEPGSTPTTGQMVLTAGADRLDPSRSTEKSAFPVCAGPHKTPRRGRELSGAPRWGHARAGSLGQDMAGRDARDAPPCPPAYPPLSPGRSLEKGPRPCEAEAIDDHKGSHRAADPRALFTRLERSCQGASQKFLLRRGIHAPGPAWSGQIASRAALPPPP